MPDTWQACRLIARATLLCVSWSIALPHRSEAQADLLSADEKRRAMAAASVTAGDSTIDVVFPPVSLNRLGCAYVPVAANGERPRLLQWYVAMHFADNSHSYSHFMGIYVVLRFPQDSTPLTLERLDSALATATLDVAELRGEPAGLHRRVPAVSASARMVDGKLQLHLEGEAAVNAFRSPGRDTVHMGWCQHDVSLPSVELPLMRQRESQAGS